MILDTFLKSSKPMLTLLYVEILIAIDHRAAVRVTYMVLANRIIIVSNPE